MVNLSRFGVCGNADFVAKSLRVYKKRRLGDARRCTRARIGAYAVASLEAVRAEKQKNPYGFLRVRRRGGDGLFVYRRGYVPDYRIYTRAYGMLFQRGKNVLVYRIALYRRVVVRVGRGHLYVRAYGRGITAF